ncbi:uncharacterized protein LOC105184077 [Harpegnathos saltator]|uniref:uncharacterized protein LOC105184077 n=1 Tax=Harpegnathos saltator TaxID=610380 RepID=UPI000948B042|nr:uncharacterized protein LOC105184077 [Harpegnathos saltator]
MDHSISHDPCDLLFAYCTVFSDKLQYTILVLIRKQISVEGQDILGYTKRPINIERKKAALEVGRLR